MTTSPLPCHDLGLMMAGAVSAGAYTAGVLDFLVEALDAWQAARDAGDSLAPAHAVRVLALTGASGGAMNAGILAGILAGRRHRPLAGEDPGTRVDDNALFDSWVNRIDIDDLLATDDLDDDAARLVSLLNGTVLADIAAAALPEGFDGARKAWAAPDLRLALAVTNLRGVPYNLGFGAGLAGEQPQPGHGMRRHADAQRFQLDAAATPATDAPLSADGRGSGWAAVRRAALASGAFPLLLPPQQLDGDPTAYARERWPVAEACGPEGGLRECLRYRAIAPHWGAEGTPATFPYVALDGGMLDNEPFALAREALVGRPPREPAPGVAGRTLLAIDPFPDVVEYRRDEAAPEGLLDLGLALLAAMKNQTRFKPDELVTDATDRVAQRQLVAPSRRIDDARVAHPLAGGAVHGFAGFLDRRFRCHDFLLGRCNAQRFLARHFRLPGDDPLFAAWTAPQRTRHADADGRLPVVPLLGSAAAALPLPPWPRMPAARLLQLRRALRRRTGALLPRVIAHLLARSSAPMRWATRVLARRQSRGWVDALVDHIGRELRERDQLDE